MTSDAHRHRGQLAPRRRDGGSTPTARHLTHRRLSMGQRKHRTQRGEVTDAQ